MSEPILKDKFDEIRIVNTLRKAVEITTKINIDPIKLKFKSELFKFLKNKFIRKLSKPLFSEDVRKDIKGKVIVIKHISAKEVKNVIHNKSKISNFLFLLRNLKSLMQVFFTVTVLFLVIL